MISAHGTRPGVATATVVARDAESLLPVSKAAGDRRAGTSLFGFSTTLVSGACYCLGEEEGGASEGKKKKGARFVFPGGRPEGTERLVGHGPRRPPPHTPPHGVATSACCLMRVAGGQGVQVFETYTRALCFRGATTPKPSPPPHPPHSASTSMVLLNKAALSSFGFGAPTALLLFQCCVAVSAAAACGAAGVARLERPSWRLVRMWAPVNVLFVGE